MIVGIERLYLSPFRKDRRIPQVSVALERRISEHGQLEPVVVRPGKDSKFEILTNVETWIAVQKAGLHSVDIVVREGISDDEARRIIDEKNELDPITEAEWFESQLQSSGQGGTFDSIASLARSAGFDRSYVSHSLRLLKLSDSIKEALRVDVLDVGHAKVLLRLKNSEQRAGLAIRTIRGEWSVRRLAREVKKVISIPRQNDGEVKKPADVLSLENRLSELVGSRVEIDMSGGKLVIDYGKNLEVLDGILSKIGYRP